MDPDLGKLASAAATAVVTALTTGVWEQAKKGIGSLWRRVHPDRAETVETELAEAREELLIAHHAGDERVERDLVNEWQSRLRRLLAAEPQLVDDVQRLIEVLRPELRDAGAQVGHVEMRARASGHSRVYQAARDQHVTER